MANNLKTVERIYGDFGAGNIPAIVAQLADDVEWEHDSVDHGIPWLRPGRGKGHVLEFFGVLGKDVEFHRFEVERLFESGDQIVATCRLSATVRSTGKTLEDLEIHLWTFGADGKARRFRHFADTHRHLNASRP